MNLSENQQIKYRVVYKGNVLLESTSKLSAENFISTLSKAVQEAVALVPVDESGAQVLLG